jgi:hypothetical protein
VGLIPDPDLAAVAEQLAEAAGHSRRRGHHR